MLAENELPLFWKTATDVQSYIVWCWTMKGQAIESLLSSPSFAAFISFNNSVKTVILLTTITISNFIF